MVLATWCIHWSYPFKQMCTQMVSSFLLPYMGYDMSMNPLFTPGICDNLFTKHSTHIYGIYFKTTGKKVSYFVN